MGWINGFEPSASRATIWRSNQLSYIHHILACLERLELPTYCLEGSCSILLSYGRIIGLLFSLSPRGFLKKACCVLEQVMGIEPTCSAWKADILPLNYTCVSIVFQISFLILPYTFRFVNNFYYKYCIFLGPIILLCYIIYQNITLLNGLWIFL